MKLQTSHLKKSIENTDMRTGEKALAEQAMASQCLRRYFLKPEPLLIYLHRKIRHGTAAAARTRRILSGEKITCRAIPTQCDSPPLLTAKSEKRKL